MSSHSLWPKPSKKLCTVAPPALADSPQLDAGWDGVKNGCVYAVACSGGNDMSPSAAMVILFTVLMLLLLMLLLA